MNKLYIIFFVMVLLVSSSVSAVTSDDVDLIGLWFLDDSSSPLFDSSTAIGNYPLITTSTTFQYPPLASYSTYSFYVDGDDTTHGDNSLKDQMAGLGNFTYGCWVDIDSSNLGDIISNRYFNTSNSEYWGFWATNFIGEATPPSCDLGKAGAVGTVVSVSSTTVTNYFHLCKYNGTGVSIFINGTEEDYNTGTYNPNIVTPFSIGNRNQSGTPSHFTTGSLDECFIINRSLTDVEITDLFDNGITEAVSGVPTVPTWVIPSVDNWHNNTNITINISHSGTDVRYYFYVDDESYFYNVTETITGYWSWLTNFSDGSYTLKASVQNTTSGDFSNNISRTLIIDTVMPTITRLTNNNWKTDNSTIISSYLNNLTINISFADDNLYQTLINISNSTGQSVYSILNTTITGTTVNISRTLDISTWGIGNFTIKLVATDTHTANSIDDYDVKTGINYFRYDTEEGNVIKITSNNLNIFTKSTTKLKDRYNFEFNFLVQQNTYKFTIESYNKIDYIEDSGYNAHFVIIGNNGRGNWVDFNIEGLNSKDYKVTKIDDYIYEIEITSNGITSFTFSSLGGLNTVVKHYLLRVGSVIDIWVYDEENYPKQINATATIGTQSANSSINISGATLINITQEITSLILTSSGFGAEEKTISITESYHNFSFNMSPVLATKLYFYDENSETLIGGETFSVYLETTGFSQTYSATTNPYTITGLSSGLYKLKASSTNYQERQYLDLNVSNTTTTFLNIYLINSTDSAEITFNIVGESLNPLEDVFVVFTRIINGTSTIIAEEESDYAGQVTLYLDYNYEYTINFSKTDYETKTITLEPKNLEYVITLVSSVIVYDVSVHEGIRYKFEPSNMILNNNTKYNFTFTLNSTVWDITNCTLKLYNGTILLDETSSYTSSGCFIRIEQDTLSMTTITSEAIYELDNLYEFTVSQQYSIIYTYVGEFSLMSFLDELSDFEMAGFDSFGRMMLAFIVIFVIMAGASIKIGFENKEILLFMLWALVGFFSYINWFYLDLNAMPDVLGIKKLFLFYLVSLMVIGFVIDKFRR